MQLNKFSTTITIRAAIIFLLAAAFYLYEFIMQVSPGVMSNTLMREFGINATALGAMSGCFYYSYTAFQLPAGLLFDRYNARIILTLMVAVCALGVLVFGLAPDIYVASIGRFIIGIGGAFAFIGVLHLTIRWVPPAYFALFVGIAQLMGSVGAIGGNAPLAIMLQHYDWRQATIILAIIGFVLAIAIWFVVRDRSLVTAAEKVERRKPYLLHNLHAIFSKSQTWAVGLYSFAAWAPLLAFSALWGVSFLEVNSGMSGIAAATAVSMTWFGVAFTSPIMGWLSDRICRRRVFLAVSAFCGSIAIALVIFVPNLPTAIIYLLMFLIGFASAGQTVAFAVIKDNNPPATNSTANGFNNTVIVAGGMLFLPLIGKLLDINWLGQMHHGVRVYGVHDFHIAFLALPICYFVAFLTSILFIKETRCRAIWQV